MREYLEQDGLAKTDR